MTVKQFHLELIRLGAVSTGNDYLQELSTVKPVKRPLSRRPQIGFQDQYSVNACQNYCRMLQGEHSVILSTFIKLPFVIKIFVLSILSGRFTQVLLYSNQLIPHLRADCISRKDTKYHIAKQGGDQTQKHNNNWSNKKQ